MADESDNNSLGNKAAFAAGAAVGSAALAAALLFVKRRKPRPSEERPPHPEDAPETD
jgi:hypothetical protein